MKVGVITGTGTEEWPGLGNDPEVVATAYGTIERTPGCIAGVEVVHISRHGQGHRRLSSHVEHRANLTGLLDAGVDCLVSLTVCGSVDRAVAPGSLVVFDDLYFPSNRLPDGTLCSWHTKPGEAGRGHWIFDRPFSDPLRGALLAAAAQRGTPAVSGCYGHVDGPRFNSRTEMAALAGIGVTAVSQTAGPEVVLAGEAGLPMALVGFVTDYANGVSDEPEPIEALSARIEASTEVFAWILQQALPVLPDLSPVGTVYRFDP